MVLLTKLQYAVKCKFLYNQFLFFVFFNGLMHHLICVVSSIVMLMQTISCYSIVIALTSSEATQGSQDRVWEHNQQESTDCSW